MRSGSAIPKLRRSSVLCSVFCVAVQFASRDSSGCVDASSGVEETLEVEILLCEVRSVSGRPGAEGAPAVVDLDEFGAPVSLDTCVLVVDVGCEAAGAIRRDYCEKGMG